MPKFQAYAHVWTAEYCYWNPVGTKQNTRALAIEQTYVVADKFWPADTNRSRRATFLGRCVVIELGAESLPPANR
jgi:hypothetical protein